ncbi:alpha/beta hydrolase [Loigolactobacillus jiayinensis]|uniref:Alpha/beta hydrolase n=1 Tax=Loigolactobacillus jiayinensis TaxID=2486016 RepID=A0ABW1REA2_9LACO|nr:alpha/beta hydrolase [Loigolactobacillus jiayinensis]
MQLIHETVNYQSEPSAELTGYLIDNSPQIDTTRTRPAVIICPGGGYEMTSDREAEPVALQIMASGAQAFVLRYSVSPIRYPVALHQLAYSVALIRQHAAQWHIDPDKIIVAGFSAGGHLAACLGVFWNAAELTNIGLTPTQMQPNGLLLCYPVITTGQYCHQGSFTNLLGADQTDLAKRTKLSVEQQVNTDTPPTFIWQTVADGSVPVENSLLFAKALRQVGVPFELHLFPNGRHGLSLATTEVNGDPQFNHPEVAVWFDLFVTWLQRSF